MSQAAAAHIGTTEETAVTSDKAVILPTFLAAIYGGYFGAGLSVIVPA